MRQCIDGACAERLDAGRDRRPQPAAATDADDTEPAAEVRPDLETKGLELGGNDAVSSFRGQAEFGMRVEDSPPRHSLGCHERDPRVEVAQDCRWTWRGERGGLCRQIRREQAEERECEEAHGTNSIGAVGTWPGPVTFRG